MIRHEIEKLIADAVRAAQAAGEIPAGGATEPLVERPQRPEHGDYASSLPLRLARAARMNPKDLAQIIARRTAAGGAIASVETAPPGFVNVRLSSPWLAAQVDEVLREGAAFGDVPLGQGKRVQVEFVSANPVGPIHVGNGRGLALGDTLARVNEAAGFEVQREYLVNDAGTQTEAFAATLYARYQQLFGRDVAIPEGGYPGEYMVELAQQLKEAKGDSLLRPPDEPYPPELHDLGEEKDNVLVRSSGAPTYFASDIAYHYDKFLLRGFDRVVDVWGADHQGHVPRMKAAVAALGVDADNLTIIIYQLVTLKRGAETVRLSKRAGEIITLREVIEEVGADAVRFNFVSRAADSHMDFDIELAKRQSQENPVYYVQYAHARIAGILAQASDRIEDWSAGDVSLLTHEAELSLIRKMLRLPELVEAIATTLEPHQLPYYAIELATAFHDFYEKCRVLSDDEALSMARLKLVSAAQLVLARALGLMGMSAPERM